MIRPSARLACLGLLAGTLFAATPAQAFFCYISGEHKGTVPLHEKPDAKSKILAQMTPSSMVREARGKSRSKDWVRVQWYSDQADAKARFVGWTVFSTLPLGECED